MNPFLSKLQLYPFTRLRGLIADVKPNPGLSPISFGIGEPRHPTPEFVKQALTSNLQGLAAYPATVGSPELRRAIAGWLERRYGIERIDPETEVLPVNGSREALFSLTQTVVDGGRPGALVLCPNPFYQIYEGAALLAGAEVAFANSDPARNFAPDLSAVTQEEWERVQLLFVCSPGNPAGAVLNLEDWKEIFALSDKYGFVIASDECYSEIYFDESKPPLGSLQAARLLGRDFLRLIAFSSLSKRSNVPGMRSGFVAGDPAILKDYLLYRTYHGCAMALPVQSASIAAWNDEQHVRDNRERYRTKFAAVTPMLAEVLDVDMPDAGFYLWANVRPTGLSDTEFTRQLLAEYNVTVLPGSFLARAARGANPGTDYVRLALVADTEECIAGAKRIAEFAAAKAKQAA
ncbi:MAG: succinyldiaminopimelate transaminase [Candidatus Protistobacter heckmanni]|nr:succinyldiaminopimelate transaminase [Candidatus Protistobacter heckmanni]